MESQAPRVIGLTGGIASGKSCARKMFEDFHVPCIDIDTLSRSIHQNPRHPVCAELRHVFPEQMNSDGALNRGSLRHYFSLFPAANQILKNILKPYVMQEVLAWTSGQSSPYVIWESALIIEDKMLNGFSVKLTRTLLVNASFENQLVRLGIRCPDWSDEERRRVIALQLTFAQMRQFADDLIENNADLQSLKKQVAYWHQRYLKLEA